jgi:hypothetical protein
VNPATPAGAPKHGESRIATPILALGERHPDSLCKQEVTGSIPVGSIDDLKGDEGPEFPGFLETPGGQLEAC